LGIPFIDDVTVIKKSQGAVFDVVFFLKICDNGKYD